MDAKAGMLAGLFERSMGLGDGWEVSDVWSEEREGAQDELHVRVAHRKGQAAECPVCHRKRGTCDTRERTWRHLDIWQHETIVHCAVPGADCPEDGVHACRMPWEVRPNPRFTALFEAQANDEDCRLGTDKYDNTWNARMEPDGSQTWVTVRDGVIQEGGRNDEPHPWDNETGLNRNPKKNAFKKRRK